ncbi:MAG: hypothetical protein ACQEXJ_05530 [Myxococcota bacterium]
MSAFDAWHAERLWIRGGAEPWLDPQGFLGSTVARLASAAARIQPLSALLDDEPGVTVLVGEAQMGKTTEIRRESAALRGRSTRQATVCLDLGGFATDSAFVAELEEALVPTPDEPDAMPTVLLDGLDEVPFGPRVAAKTLVRRMQRLETLPARVVLSCRTGVWTDIGRELDGLPWGPPPVWELAPLRWDDAQACARHVFGGRARTFLEEIRARGLAPLASRPGTLKLLVDHYRAEERLPDDGWLLMEAACRRHCTDVTWGEHTADERLAGAARLAAVTVLSGLPHIALEPEIGSEDRQVRLGRVAGGSVRSGHQEVDVEEGLLREVLQHSGLFRSSEDSCWRWIHRTYEEFLAAWTIAAVEPSEDQLRALLGMTLDPEGNVPPQLLGVAAWVSTFRSDVFGRMLERQPEALLQADLGSLDSERKSQLVEALLEQLESGEIPDWDRALWSGLRSLRYEGLAEQLEPWVVSNERAAPARRGALRILEACGASGLEQALVELAFDRDREVNERRLAVDALRRTSVEVRSRLRPLAMEPIEEDADDELKGAALHALWPDALRAEEVFEALTPFKRDRPFGTYKLFTSIVLPAALEPDHIPPGLAWVALRAEDTYRERIPWRQLEDRILSMAWEHRDCQDVLEALASACLERARHLKRTAEKLVEQPWPLDEDDDRRALVATMVEQASTATHESEKLVSRIHAFIEPRDLGWILDRVDAAAARERRAWAQAARIAFSSQTAGLDGLNRLLALADRYEEVGSVFADVVEPIELDSERARLLKRNWEFEQQCIEETPRVHEEAERATRDRLEELLELEPSVAWPGILRVLLAEGDGPPAEMRAWKDAGDELRERILDAAASFLESVDPEADAWFDGTTCPRAAHAGSYGIRLLSAADPERLEALPREFRERWLPVLVWWIETLPTGEAHGLTGKLMEWSEDATAWILRRLSAGRRPDARLSGVLARLHPKWREVLASDLLGMCESSSQPTQTRVDALGWLVSHDDASAITLARSWLADASRDEALRIEAGAALARQDPGELWPLLWSRLEDEPSFGEELLARIIERDEVGDRLAAELPAPELAKLFTWMIRRFPPETDPTLGRTGTIPRGYWLRHWRDRLVSVLAGRGTWDAVDELAGLVEEHPKIEWLPWMLREAREEARGQSWVPLEPEQVVGMLLDSARRPIRSDEELHAVVLSALCEVQREMRGRGRPVRRFHRARGPDSERGICATLEDMLRTKLAPRLGILIQREVEIRPPAAGRPGEHVDFDIVALPEGGREVRLTIEVKGIWHRDVRKAMETQLVQRYLAASDARHGLYLVAWFEPDELAQGQSTRGFDTPAAARSFFADQAKGLSRRFGVHVTAFVLDCSGVPLHERAAA